MAHSASQKPDLAAERLLYPTDSGVVRGGLSSAQRMEWERRLAEAPVDGDVGFASKDWL